MLFVNKNWRDIDKLVNISYYSSVMPKGRARTVHAPPDSFGDLLYKLRVEKKLTITELAKKAKVTRPYITGLEQGKGLPSPKVTRQLAEALGVLPIILKMACGQIEFWDLYPVDLEQPPSGYSLSKIKKDERIQLLWFLRYVRSAGKSGSSYLRP